MARSYGALGVNLLWLALVLDGVALVLNWNHLSPGFALARIPVLSAIGFLIWWFITAKVAAGRTWARVVYLIFTVLDVLSWIGISVIPRLASVVVHYHGAAYLIEIAELLLQVAGIALVFFS